MTFIKQRPDLVAHLTLFTSFESKFCRASPCSKHELKFEKLIHLSLREVPSGLKISRETRSRKRTRVHYFGLSLKNRPFHSFGLPARMQRGANPY
jgi:hypothetical protein